MHMDEGTRDGPGLCLQVEKGVCVKGLVKGAAVC